MSDNYFGFDLHERRTLEALGVTPAAAAQQASLATSVANLNAWATALATKLNADAGVTDVNYDTNPQA